LDDHLKDVKHKIEIPGLKYIHMQKSSEYLIEVPVGKVKKVPASWLKISGTKAVSRYHSPFVIEKLKQLVLHRENLDTVCQQAWLSFLGEFGAHYITFREVVQRIAVLDCLCSLASLARNPSYTKPVFSEKRQLIIKDGRHPIVEATMADRYVPNSTVMEDQNERCMIITGPNMGGKSSYIRQIALIIVMAQIGSYVPASEAILSPFDAVYTRMGAQDDISVGQSTFFVELQETSDILKMATPRSLVILDELGRGTSTHDGVAIAYATLQFLVEKLGCFSLFVTHYPLLAQLEKTYPKAVVNYHMSFLEETDEDCEIPKVTFLYKVTKGAAKNSYGLNVAKIAGIPPSILKEAANKSEELKNTISQGAFANSKIEIFKQVKEILEKEDNEVDKEKLKELYLKCKLNK